MDGSKLIAAYCVGGAGLAFWVLLRFPRFGPKTIVGAAVAVIGVFAVAAVVPSVLQSAVADGSRTGGFVALLGLVLPTLAAMWWSAACLLRAFCGLLSGMH